MAGNPAPQLSIGPQLQKDDAWARAKATYEEQRKILKEADLIEITRSDGPQDLASFIEQIRNEKGAYAKTVGAVNKCLGFLKEHEGPIDLLAQAGGSPGCLAWGLIKWTLQMVRGYTEEYEKLIEALANICEWLQPIKLDAATFANSENVQGCIVKIYSLILTFWEKGILAYTPIQKKRHRLFHLAKATWVDFDKELSSLKDAFTSQRQIFEANVRAVHRRETKVGQVIMLSGIKDATQIAQRREIAAWLGPPKDAPYGNDFHEVDLEAQFETRHPGTCQWIFDQSDFLDWRKGSSTEYQPALYIASGPGGGKSVLTATVVKDLQSSQAVNRIPVFYFFFVNTDRHKNSSLAAARSLLYQVYEYGRRSRVSEFDELEMDLEVHARENLKSPEKIWMLLKNYLDCVSRAYVVIDALDECVDAPTLFQALSRHSLQKWAGLFVSGRLEVAEQCEKLRELRRVDIGVEEASKDIELFLQTKCEGAFKPSLRQKTIDAVLAKAGGMFLWVSLVVQALESLNHTTEVASAIASLPDDLYAAYDKTLARMATNMKNQTGKQRLCRGALQWLACSERAMSVLELFAALSIGYRPEEILFTEKDVISACGPLAVVRQNTIQLVHFSTREYLTGDYLANSAQLLRHFYVDLKQTNVTMARACTQYMRSAKVENLFPVERNSDQNRLKRSGIDTSCLAPESLKDAWRDKVNDELPFAEYAVMYWLPHLQASTYGMDAQNEDSSISIFLKSHSTLVWIELYFTINCQQSDMEKLSLVVGECFQSSECMPTSLEVAWRHAILALLYGFGSSLRRSPNEARHLDPTILAQYDAELLKWQNTSEACYEKHMILRVGSAESRPMPSMTDADSKHLYLPPGVDTLSSPAFLHFHRQSRSLLFAERATWPGACAWLYCQNTVSGYRSKPLIVLSSSSTTLGFLAGTGVCKDSKYLCLLYTRFDPDPTSSLIVLRVDLQDDPTISDWATLLFTIDCRECFTIDLRELERKQILHVTSEFVYLGGRTYSLKDGECVQDIPTKPDTVGPIFHYADGAMLFQTDAPITEDAEDTSVQLSSCEDTAVDYRGRRVTLGPGQAIAALSNEGRYVLAVKEITSLQKYDVYVFDTFLKQDHHLTRQIDPKVCEYFAFYGGDEWLIGFVPTPLRYSIAITRYHLPSLFSGSGNLGLSVIVPDLNWQVSFCINDVEKEAYVVRGRKWYRLDLNSLEWKDELPRTIAIQPKYTQVSADGRQLAIVKQTNGTSWIQMFDLQSGLLNREYNSLLSIEHRKALASPDLRIWRIGNPGPDNLYYLEDANSPSTRTVKAFHIPESSHGLGKDEIHGDCFSACGKYFAFWGKNTSTKTSGSETDITVEITILELDLVHSNVHVHSRISITRPSTDSVALQFHPKLSMLAIVLGYEAELAELYLHDLQTLKTNRAWAAVPDADMFSSPDMTLDLEFNEYGLFVSLSRKVSDLYIPAFNLSFSLDQRTLTDQRRALPSSSLPLSARVHSSLRYYDCWLQLRHDSGAIVLSVSRYRADPDNSALPSLSVNPHPEAPTNIRRLVWGREARYHLTIIQTDPRSFSNPYLLLGDTAHSKLRLLLVFDDQPPELKFLDLSWHDIIMDIDDFYANRDANLINDSDTYNEMNVIPRQYNRKTEGLSMRFLGSI